jgi:hypothetical protein
MERSRTQSQLVAGSQERSKRHNAYGELIRVWILKFALNARQELDENALQGYQRMWESAFAELGAEALTAAFKKTLRQCKFMPSVADVLTHVESARKNANEEQAELEWQWVLEYIRRHYHPDLSVQRGPQIADRMRHAIRAAGGLAYISNCEAEAKQWAKKRFIEAHLRWEELERDYALLPEGEFKASLRALAESKSIPQLPERRY